MNKTTLVFPSYLFTKFARIKVSKKINLGLLTLILAGLLLIGQSPEQTRAQIAPYLQISQSEGPTGTNVNISGYNDTTRPGCGILSLFDRDQSELIFGETCWARDGVFNWVGTLPRAGIWTSSDNGLVNKDVPVGRIFIGFYRPLVITPTTSVGSAIPFNVTENSKGAFVTFSPDTGIIPPQMGKMNDLWVRTDFLVSQGEVKRSWLWGSNYTGFYESYQDAPNKWRYVRYYDKSRMEVTDPYARTSNNPYYVSNGLLVKEMVNGRIQVGDNGFQEVAGCIVPVAGDLDANNHAPVFAQFQLFLNFNDNQEGGLINRTVGIQARNGIEPESYYNRYKVFATSYIKETKHYLANVFKEFLDSSGPLLNESSKTYSGKLFTPPFYATGLPITEAYWTKTTVAGVEKDVLVQLFERRVLTYTPSNSASFQVEMGNVGLQYYRWRYLSQ